jgi:hypothetical protein
MLWFTGFVAGCDYEDDVTVGAAPVGDGGPSV